MPNYQAVANPNMAPSKSNPYVTKHFKKSKPRRPTDRNPRRPVGVGGGEEEESTFTPPLMRDLLIMREGIRSISGYKELSGESEMENQRSMVEPGLVPNTPLSPIIDKGAVDQRRPKGRNDPGPPEDEGGFGFGAIAERGRRRGQQFNPQELELLRKAMLLIQRQQ